MKVTHKFGRMMAAIATTVMVVSCSNEEPESSYTPRPWKDRQDIVLTRSEQQIVENHGKFAFDFFRELNTVYTDENWDDHNIVISPLALSLDLSILANAVDDDLYSKLLRIMNLDPSTTRSELNDLSRLLVDELLKVDPKIDLKISHSVWTDQRLQVKQDFADEVMAKYNAPCQAVLGTKDDPLVELNF